MVGTYNKKITCIFKPKTNEKVDHAIIFIIVTNNYVQCLIFFQKHCSTDGAMITTRIADFF